MSASTQASKNKGLKRFYYATIYSLQGLKKAYGKEPAFRYEVLGGFVVVPLAAWLADTVLQFALLVSSWLILLAVELINSGIEAVVDRIGTEYHELAGMAKDTASAAVLMILIMNALVWLGVLYEVTAAATM